MSPPRRLPIALALALSALILPAATQAQSGITSAVDGAVPHAYGRLLGVVPIAGQRLRTLPLPPAAVTRRAETHAQAPPTATGQPPPPGAPTLCPPNASQAPFPLCFYGGHVLHSSSVYTLFWQPNPLPGGVSGFDSTYMAVVNGFFQNVGAASGQNNVYEVGAQYFDVTGSAAYASSFGASAVDTSAYPPNRGLFGGCPTPLLSTDYCLTDDQIVQELDAQINAHGWPRGLGPVYMVLLPPGVAVCAASGGATPACSYNVFCAYHSAYQVNSGAPTLYAVLPYAAVQGCDNGQHPNGASADAVLDTASHEHNEAITDPLGDGWLDLQGNENGDKCARHYGPAPGSTAFGQFDQTIASGNYFIQSEWSNAQGGCAMALADVPPRADFGVSPSPAVGQPVIFTAAASDAEGPLSALNWSFGDGPAGGAGARISHTFAAAGSYVVVLTATDGAGLNTIVSHSVTVGLPPPPPPAVTPVRRFGLSPHQSLRTALRRKRLTVTVVCATACSVRVRIELRVAGRLVTLGSSRRALAHAGSMQVTIHLSASALRKLRRAGKLALTIVAAAIPHTGAAVTTAKSVTLVR